MIHGFTGIHHTTQHNMVAHTTTLSDCTAGFYFSFKVVKLSRQEHMPGISDLTIITLIASSNMHRISPKSISCNFTKKKQHKHIEEEKKNINGIKLRYECYDGGSNGNKRVYTFHFHFYQHSFEEYYKYLLINKHITGFSLFAFMSDKMKIKPLNFLPHKNWL